MRQSQNTPEIEELRKQNRAAVFWADPADKTQWVGMGRVFDVIR